MEHAMRIVVILFVLAILGSMGSALYYLFKDRDKGASDRLVKALTARVVLSVTLFALLMLGYYLGILPHSKL
jgi:hypothetical protein